MPKTIGETNGDEPRSAGRDQRLSSSSDKLRSSRSGPAPLGPLHRDLETLLLPKDLLEFCEKEAEKRDISLVDFIRAATYRYSRSIRYGSEHPADHSLEDVSARLPKTSVDILKKHAAARKISLSFLAAASVSEFLNRPAADAALLPVFDTPPPGRVRAKDIERVKAMRAQLTRLSLRLTPEEIDEIGDIAAGLSVSRGDLIGRVMVAEANRLIQDGPTT